MEHVVAIFEKPFHCTMILLLITGTFIMGYVNQDLIAQAPKRQQVSDVPQLTVIVSKSIIVNTAEPIERVSITDAAIADQVVISPQQVMIHGKAPGIVSLILWDRTGKSTSYDLVVEVDISLLQSLFTGSASVNIIYFLFLLLFFDICVIENSH